MLSASRERRREDFEAVKCETGFDAVEIERVQRAADEAFAASEEEWALNDTEYVTALRSATDAYLGVYRAEIRNGAIGALRIGFAKVAHDKAWADAGAQHAEKSKAIVAKWTYLQRLHDGMTTTFAPKHVEARREAAREAFRNLSKFTGPLNAPPAVLPSKASEAHDARQREAHRQVSTTRTTSTTRTRSTVAAAPAASAGSPPSRGAQGSRPPAPSADDDPHPPGRIRLAHTWHIAGISTAPAGSVVSFKAVAS